MASQTGNVKRCTPPATRRSSRRVAVSTALEKEITTPVAQPLPDALLEQNLTQDDTGPTTSRCYNGIQKYGGEPGNGSFIAQLKSGRSSSSRKTEGLRPVSFDGDPVKYILSPVSEKDHEEWKGWCEVESEPAFFNVMLSEFGVEGVKVQEVVSLDEDMLAFLPSPVFGLIFLFRFKEDDPAKQEVTCPDHIWFANQTTSNACATIALLNIVMNIPSIELGVTLEQLRNFSMPLTPAIRGYTVGNHDYLRKIHNSFTRKMDMLNADLFLSNDSNAKKSRNKGSAKKVKEVDQDQAGFHFIAFVPIEGNVWKLDGLERQPMNLGEFKNEWMDIARPIVEQRMRQYEDDQIQFNLLALCKSPLVTIPKMMACNIKAVDAVEELLSRFQPDWRIFISVEETNNFIHGPNKQFKITQEYLDEAQISHAIIDKLQEPSLTTMDILEIRRELLATQRQLRTSFLEEQAAFEYDVKRAAGRRHDFSPMIYTWIKMLADNGVLEGLVKKS